MHRQLLAIVFYVSSLAASAQVAQQKNATWACGDDRFLFLQKELLPNHGLVLENHNLQLQRYLLRSGSARTMQPSDAGSQASGLQDSGLTIPVVIHVVYPSGEAYGTGTNISYAQIRSQMEALNAAFGKEYAAYNGQSHPAYAQNTHIRFCLARTAPAGTASWATGPGGTEYGVMRYADRTAAYNHTISGTSAGQLLALTHPKAENFPFTRYLNIWLVKTIDGGDNVMGYAPRPLMKEYPLDGIVIRADIFGDNTAGGNYPLRFGLTQGKVLAHEAGHYLDLYHIFQGGCAGTNQRGAPLDACDLNGDYVCDTKPCTTQNVLCGNGPYTTCTVNYNTGTTKEDMINDYMSYADDDCMNTFTSDQANRMRALLNVQRQNLWQPANLVATGVLSLNGCVPPYLNASINTNQSVYCTGTPVRFSNPTAGSTAVSWQWSTPGGLPQNGSRDTVSVVYNTPGNYKVTLTVSDGTQTRTDSLAFTVYSCSIDSSLASMAHWYFGDYCSIDFSSGFPIKTTTALTQRSMHGEPAYTGQLPYVDATVSLSDSSGSLLFYSNGVSVWNSNHKKMTTAPIFGHSDINASTGLCYIPFPGRPDQYFLAGVYPDFDGSSSGLRFVVVDLAAGTVSPYQEISYPSRPKRLSEYLTIVPHCNGTDYWIITKGYGIEGDNNFYSFLVTAAGINPSQVPVVTRGILQPSYGGAGYQLKADRSGEHLILSSPNPIQADYFAALYDFNSRTGEISNERQVPGASGYSNIQTGAAFSPNGAYFYLMRSSNFATNGPPYWLFQYRVSDLKYNIIPTTGFYFGSPFQLGPDNQLYITNGLNYLARLANPDVWGGAIFDGEFISFSESTYTMKAGNSLPAFIDARRKEPAHPDFTINRQDCQTFALNSLCFDNYTATWDFGDGTAGQTGHALTHTFAAAGEFSVTLTLKAGTKVYGSVSKKVTVPPIVINITGPDAVCRATNFATQYFAPQIREANYQWFVSNGTTSGATNLSYVSLIWTGNPPDSARLLLQLSVEQHCVLTAEKAIKLFQRPVISWSLPEKICLNDPPLLLRASPQGGVFSGPGISDSLFYPAVSGEGKRELKYSFRDTAKVCEAESVKVLTVAACNAPLPPANAAPVGPSMPNAFTPNGDGVNDVFRIPQGVIDHLDRFSIYNRWGGMVFTTQAISKGWDGKIKGLPADTGTYVYYISGTATGGSPVTRKGTVILVR